MSGIDNNFVNKYIEFKTNDNKGLGADNTLSEAELNTLKRMAKGGNIDPKAAERLRNFIINNTSDSTISEDDRKLLLTLGAAIDNASQLKDLKLALGKDKVSTNAPKSANIDPSSSTISDLLDRGFSEKLGSESKYRSEHEIKSALRDKLSNAANMVMDALFMSHGMSKPEALRVESTVEASRSLLQEGISMLDDFLLSSGEKVSCISSALNDISEKAGFNVKDIPERKLSQNFLKQATGKDWDGINIAQQNKNGKLEELLNPNKDKALVVVGTHTFVFKGFKDGKLEVTDPSDANKTRYINKDNPAAVVYVLGKGDGADGKPGGTNAVLDKSKVIKPYNQIDGIKNLSSADRADNTGESWNIRKVLSGLGDIKFLNKVQSFAEQYNKSSPQGKEAIIKKLQEFLSKEMGVSLDTQELRAMIQRLTVPVTVDGKTTTVLEQIKSTVLNGSSEQKNNYTFGIQYSDINLKDYFTNTSPEDMLRVLKCMIEGKEGC